MLSAAPTTTSELGYLEEKEKAQLEIKRKKYYSYIIFMMTVLFLLFIKINSPADMVSLNRKYRLK